MTEALKCDSSILLYYVVGLTIGCIIVSILPKNEEEIEGLKTSANSEAQKQEEQGTTGKVKSELEKRALSWDGDNIPREELERIRKRFRLTPRQMARVVESSKAQATMDLSSSSLTPHQQMNRMMYLIMISVLIYILNRDYGNVVLVWFVRIFPKEAQVLGILKS